MFRKILVGFDGSPSARRALRHAVALARDDGAELHALWVEEPMPHYASGAEEVRAEESDVAGYFERLQADARQEAERQGVGLQTEAVRGHAAHAIVEYARQVGADLVIVGQRGHSGVLRHLLGGIADRIVDSADCSVLVVRDADAT